MSEHLEMLYKILPFVHGYIYPNELELNWGLLIVLYPYLTGLVAGAFILASLVRVFNVSEVKPIFRLALLTALAFLMAAPLPLLVHLGHPERGYEILFTPKTGSAMAMFGFIYIWYLMAILLLEIWFSYRKSFVLWSETERNWKKWLYKILTLGVNDIAPATLKLDEKISYWITVIGIPSAVILHGYVGFIFGSVKANPWWSTPLVPVIFLMSAMASGVALVLILYMILSWRQRHPIDIACLNTIGKYLFVIFTIDFSLEMLDLIHRIYESEESFSIISILLQSHLSWTLFGLQIFVGSLIPLFLLGGILIYKPKPEFRKRLYFFSAILVLIGVFAMRWNVIVGGQLFSLSFLGFTTYKLSSVAKEVFQSVILMIAPFIFLAILLYLLPPKEKEEV